MTPRRILVTDGTQRSALAVVRSLGKIGHTVFVCAPRVPSLAGSSRYSFAESEVPSALVSPVDFVNEVTLLVDRWRIDTLIPITEASLLALLPERASVGATIPFPDESVFRGITDKGAVLAAAKQLGIATPKQVVVRAKSDLAAVHAALLDYPVVLKPSRSVGENDGQRVALGVMHVPDAKSLKPVVESLDAAAFPLLVQQRIVGPGTGIFLLVWNGVVRAAFAHRRIREKPASGGVSVYSQSVAADPELVERSRQLLERMKWNGVAMIEYKLDASTGVPYLMEVNGRFWGSLQLAIDAGVDFPALLVAASSGHPLPPVTTYRIGARSRWWWGDVDQLLSRWRKSDAELALPPDAPSKLRATLEFFSLLQPHNRSDVFRVRDVKPFVRETLDWFQRR
ncbi:MAG: ATP-grasp domain-containing protein [Gemmatimonadaceae bacterium]|nr:ATP-grasp domain-containing protein [Gemmatimonadaceae bacterium]